jgi:hypothetical protein
VRLILPEYRVSHRIEESAGLILFGRAAGLQFLNAAVGALQGLVLHQHGLHQRVDGVGRRAQTLRDRRGGAEIAWRTLHLREPVEKIVNQLAFLRCHGVLSVTVKSAGQM